MLGLVCSQWLNNIDQIPFCAILRSLLFSVGLVCIVYFISRLIFHPTHKTAIFASFVLVLFFTFTGFACTRTPHFPSKYWVDTIYTTFSRYGSKLVRLVIKSLGSVT